MFSEIQRNEPARSAPSAEPVARRPQTEKAALKNHLRKLAGNLLCRGRCVGNGEVASANLSRAQPVNIPPALNLSQLPPDVFSDVISFLDFNSKNNFPLVSKEVKGLVRQQQRSLTLLDWELSRA